MAFGLSWLKPELDEPKYYIHIAVIIAVVYFLMTLKDPGNNLLLWGLYLVAGDTVSHSILKLS